MRFANCLSFVASLTSLSPQLQGAQAFGTDGEQLLIDASIHEFGLSQNLRCFEHFHQNTKEELTKEELTKEELTKEELNKYGRHTV